MSDDEFKDCEEGDFKDFADTSEPATPIADQQDEEQSKC